MRNAFTVTFSREIDANTLTFFTGQQIYDFHVRADGADGVARALCVRCAGFPLVNVGIGVLVVLP